MASRKRSQATADTPSCKFCSHSKFIIQYLHWLKFPDDRSLAGHLTANLERKGKEELDGAVERTIGWVRTVRLLYGHIVDVDGLTLPLWKKYLAAHNLLPQDHKERDAEIARRRSFSEKATGE